MMELSSDFIKLSKNYQRNLTKVNFKKFKEERTNKTPDNWKYFDKNRDSLNNVAQNGPDLSPDISRSIQRPLRRNKSGLSVSPSPI
jgi:hypothetical protein